jgi:hypothetical protein
MGVSHRAGDPPRRVRQFALPCRGRNELFLVRFNGGQAFVHPAEKGEFLVRQLLDGNGTLFGGR